MQKESVHIRGLESPVSVSSSQQSIFCDSYACSSDYYVDELGFYRYTNIDESFWNECPVNLNSIEAQSSLERNKKQLRHKLGISHFDRIDNHAKWKSDWDEFMLTTILKFNRNVFITGNFLELVRSGIPHDYRPKVWPALIHYWTKDIRKKYGQDLYEKIVSSSEFHFPTHQQQQQKQQQQQQQETQQTPNNFNNNGPKTANSALKAALISSFTSSIATTASSEDRMLGSRTHTDSNNSTYDKCKTEEQPLEEYLKQINLDLLRTLPNNRHFQTLDSFGIQRVKHVLGAYACFNPSVGYCQGMNRLAAIALLVLPERDAFFAMIAIINCIKKNNYYLKPWLAQVDCFVVTDFLKRALPKLHKHLVKWDIQLAVFSWFFTIFVDGFQPELMFRIWDVFLLEGDKVLFKYAIAILAEIEIELLTINDFPTMSCHLRKVVVMQNRLDIESLTSTAFSRKLDFVTHSKIEQRRRSHIKRMESLIID